MFFVLSGYLITDLLCTSGAPLPHRRSPGPDRPLPTAQAARTPEFEELRESGRLGEALILVALRTSWRQSLQVIGCIALQAAAFYFVFVYMETHTQNQLAFSAVADLAPVVSLWGPALGQDKWS
ncbi:hypothetical protein ADK57_32450 [Streptomyces sp. MMG1533]|uniref:hypothetical protein n=1 Tax=Streptomyces sp. MMG1533 TaxID=1415546 RepID=UPI0006ADD5DC|nr:hypothetical protein [Streptomyces sp. MMG1533]KOU59828.1 hypothetical protein ADK57_32450 [Streptomyces sp. MMG1533]